MQLAREGAGRSTAVRRRRESQVAAVAERLRQENRAVEAEACPRLGSRVVVVAGPCLESQAEAAAVIHLELQGRQVAEVV
jgi:hypothetical protein